MESKAIQCASRKTQICRLCQTEVGLTHAVAIFSQKGLKERWTMRISDVLDVRVFTNDAALSATNLLALLVPTLSNFLSYTKVRAS